MKDDYELVIDSSTRKDRSTVHSNAFTTHLSNPLYNADSISLVSCSIPYINGSNPVVGIDVHAYYLVVEIPGHGLLTNDIYSVQNSFETSGNLSFAYTGSFIVPQLDGSTTTNYILSGNDQALIINKFIPVIESITLKMYYYDTVTENYELYPFDTTPGAVEEYVIKFKIHATRDKREREDAPKKAEIAPPPTDPLPRIEALMEKYMANKPSADASTKTQRRWIVGIAILFMILGFLRFTASQTQG
jgi:hypothetical protein